MRDTSPAAMEIDGRQKGVIHGQTFRFGAPPPALDRLAHPLTLPSLKEPTLKTLIERPESGNILLRIASFLKKQRRETPRERLQRRMRDAMTVVRSTLIGAPAAEGGGQGKFHRSRGLEHPYQLKTVLDLIPELPDSHAAERRYFEELIFAIVQQYKALISERHVWTFSFHAEAQQYFHLADRVRRRLIKRDGREDMKSLAQLVYDNYFHGIYYYMMSIYIRESAEKANSLFIEFCKASKFIASIDWDGAILEQPSLRRLPSRGQLLYFAIRDESVLKQFNNHYGYAREFKDLLGSFPIDGVRQEGDGRGRGRARIKHFSLGGGEPEGARAG